MDNKAILEKLELPKGKLRMVLDTDTYNEIDDQFALTYALKSSDRLSVEAVYAAPFFNTLSSGPKDGMEKSYNEILNVMSKLGIKDTDGYVFKGSDRYLGSRETPVDTPAARDLIKRAMSSDETLYVVAIGAITNVASALLLEPKIADKIVIVWLGGHAFHWHDTLEFNLRQDIESARVVFDSGAPVVMLPCMGVVSALTTTVPELEANIYGKSEIGTYLTDIVRRCGNGRKVFSRVIWDVSAVAYLINEDWCKATLEHSPMISNDGKWCFDHNRHFIKYVNHVNRDAIFTDLFDKLSK